MIQNGEEKKVKSKGISPQGDIPCIPQRQLGDTRAQPLPLQLSLWQTTLRPTLPG